MIEQCIIPDKLNSFDESKEDKFLIFSSLRSRQGQSTSSDSYKNKVDIELIQYLNNKNKSLPCVNKYNIIKKLFIKYNIDVCSAPIKRLFSFAGTIMSPTKSCLFEYNFKNFYF